MNVNREELIKIFERGDRSDREIAEMVGSSPIYIANLRAELGFIHGSDGPLKDHEYARKRRMFGTEWCRWFDREWTKATEKLKNGTDKRA